MKGVTLPTETVFVMEMSPIKFGLGATDEIGYDALRWGVKKAVIFTDRHVAELGLPERVRQLLEEQGVKAEVYDGTEVEPTDRSMEDAAEYARAKEFDALIAVGGGSVIDTCKAANLLACYPAPLLDYINKPVGKGAPVPGPLKPLIAVPTTAGTGSATTAAAITHVVDQHVKAGISHRLLRPALGIVDPLNTLTAPPEVTAAAGNYAGIGFGNAGVHIPHAAAYPIAGLVRDYVPAGYRTRHPLVPHGMSVILTAPAAFRFTYPAAPERHLRAAELMGVPVDGLSPAERREALPRALIGLMRDVGLPGGLSAIGYGGQDIAALIEGTLRQPRLLAGAPRAVGAAELDWILSDAMQYW